MESDSGSSFPETLTTDVQAVFADETGNVAANFAVGYSGRFIKNQDWVASVRLV